MDANAEANTSCASRLTDTCAGEGGAISSLCSYWVEQTVRELVMQPDVFGVAVFVCEASTIINLSLPILGAVHLAVGC